MGTGSRLPAISTLRNECQGKVIARRSRTRLDESQHRPGTTDTVKSCRTGGASLCGSVMCTSTDSLYISTDTSIAIMSFLSAASSSSPNIIPLVSRAYAALLSTSRKYLYACRMSSTSTCPLLRRRATK